jgi:retinoid hydroxylase
MPSTQPPLPPGSLGLPLIGETLSFLIDPNFARKRQQQYGSVFKSNILGRPAVIFCGPEANEFVLSSHADCFSWRGGWPGTFQELLGESLFLQEGAEHQRNRRLLMPAFHGKALEGYFSTMVAISEAYLTQWEAQQTLTWFPELKKFTFEVASVLLLGKQWPPTDSQRQQVAQSAQTQSAQTQSAQTRRTDDQPADPQPTAEQLADWFGDLTDGLFTLPIRWGPTPYRRALQGRDRLLDYIGQEIAHRREALERNRPSAASQPTSPDSAIGKDTGADSKTVNRKHTDVLSLLLTTEDETGNRLSDDEIKVQALLMLFAGHETTTSMLTSLIMALALHPDVLAKARAEQQQIMGNQDSALTLAQIQQMPYLDQVLKEVERLYPPVGGGFRKVIKTTQFNGYQIPEGWLALYRIESAHQDERCYTNPEQFDPERFSPERAEQKRFDYSLVSFGGGPRICLGMAFAKLEIKILAAQLIRRYQWPLTPNQNLTMRLIPSLRPADGLKGSLLRL